MVCSRSGRGPADVAAELLQRGVPEGNHHRQFQIKHFVDPGHDPGSTQRVAADGEEVVEDPHGLHADHFPPDVGHKGLNLVMRGGGKAWSLRSASFSASPTRWILPVGPLGMASTITIRLGTL